MKLRVKSRLSDYRFGLSIVYGNWTYALASTDTYAMKHHIDIYYPHNSAIHPWDDDYNEMCVILSRTISKLVISGILI